MLNYQRVTKHVNLPFMGRVTLGHTHHGQQIRRIQGIVRATADANGPGPT